MTAWRCTSCGEPVELSDARAHYDQCTDPNDNDEDDTVPPATRRPL